MPSEKDDATPRRQCDTCKQVYDLTPKYFPRYPGAQNNFKHTCRKCKKELARRKQLDAIEKGGVDILIQRMRSGGANIPHTAEMLESLMHYFGGVNGFASIALKQYWDAPPGSRMRNSILEMMVKLASKNTEQGGAKRPIQLYSEEELEAEINRRLEQAVLTYGGKRYLNAPQEEASLVPGVPPADSEQHLLVPEGRVADLASRVEFEAHRSLEALQAQPQAGGLPPGPGE